MGDQSKALGFAMAGVAWDLIAEQCGYDSPAEAVADVAEALEQAQPDVALSPGLSRKIEIARLSRLLAGVWAPAINGNNRAVEVSSALIRQLCKMQGVEEIKPGAVPENAAIASAYDELAARRPGTVNGPRRDGNGRRRGRRT